MVIIDLVCHCFIVLLAHQLIFCIVFIVILSQLTFLSSLVLYSLVTLMINFFDTTHPSFGNLCNLMSTFGLTQVVDNYTHLYRDNCHSLNDLVLLSNPSFLSSCQTIPPLSNSDHLGIWVEIKTKHANKTVRPPRHSVWHYSQADWDRARERIETFDWDAGMVEDINLSWS